MATPPPPQPAAKKKKTSAPIIPWSDEETSQLIEAYQDKWYSLRRGPLKSAHWEDIAAAVAAAAAAHPAKTALQCRHKMEKLRRRFRSESRRVGPSAWPFFVAMDRMLRGPFPISARPMDDGDGYGDDSTDDDGEEDRDRDRERERGQNGNFGAKSRSIDCILRRPATASRFGSASADGPPAKRPRRGGGGGEAERGSVVAKLAAEMRGFSERMVAVEREKMEVAREMERFRMEMERKRIDMIVRSQSKIVDAIARVFGSPNRHLIVAKEET